MTWIEMTKSVGGDYVAGQKYNVAADQADALIIKGYADGDLSRDYTDEERRVIVGQPQVVAVGNGG